MEKPIDCVIIPARGGSKRIPKKNMQLFCGIPMLQRSIALAKKVSDNVFVSSDDVGILDFAKSCGAYPFIRDSALATDMTPTLPVVKDVLLSFIDEAMSKGFTQMQDSIRLQKVGRNKHNKSLLDSISFQITSNSKVLCLYPTAMFATQRLLIESCAKLSAHKQAAYIVSTIEAAKVFRSFTCTEEGFLQFLFPQFLPTRTQDLPQAFLDAGQFYLGYAESFLLEIALLGEKSIGMPLEYAYDIDTMQDLVIAQSIFMQINEDKQ